MPYIPQATRKQMEDCPIEGLMPEGPGELNYILTAMCLRYLRRYGSICYQDYNDVIGALECAKLEMYRRQAAPYEDKKKEENGDVF